jgi:hypothetical protein
MFRYLHGNVVLSVVRCRVSSCCLSSSELLICTPTCQCTNRANSSCTHQQMKILAAASVVEVHQILLHITSCTYDASGGQITLQIQLSRVRLYIYIYIYIYIYMHAHRQHCITLMSLWCTPSSCCSLTLMSLVTYCKY